MIRNKMNIQRPVILGDDRFIQRRTGMRTGRIRIWAAAAIALGLILLCAWAGADTAADITSSCKFNAGSGRKTFSKCTDRSYKTYWRTNNGDKCFVEVTVPNGTASGVMVQWYEHPHASCADRG